VQGDREEGGSEVTKVAEMTEMKDAASDDLSLEGSLAELETIVRALEDGDLTLEESLKAFERGVSLVRRCNALLDGAEQKIEILTGDLPEDLAR
jgi:exodeoxyribonuclease VII small subunit